MLLDVLRYVGGPLLGAVIGGLIVHFGSRHRDVENDRRKQRIDYLVDTYRVLASSANRAFDSQRAQAFEDALSDILLLGSPAQIALASNAMETFARERGVSIDELLVSLRHDLRRELGLATDSREAIPIVRISHERESNTASAPLRISALHEVDIARITAETTAAASVAASHKLFEEEGASAQLLSYLPQRLSPDTLELAETAPREAVERGYDQLREALLRLIGPTGTDTESSAFVDELARIAANEGLIRPESVRSIEGIVILANLATAREGDDLTAERANEFLALVSAVLYTIE